MARGLFIQMTGLSGAGKSTLSQIVARALRKKGHKVEIIDGDEYRLELCKDLGFSKEDRNTNIRRLSFVGNLLTRNNVITIMAAINPYEQVREELKKKYDDVIIVYIKCDIRILEDRDPKDLYRRAKLPNDHPEKINNFTGISDPFEEPKKPDLIIETDKTSVEESSDKLEKFIIEKMSI